MNDDVSNTSTNETSEEAAIKEDDLNDLCKTCGKWIVQTDNYCYGCKKPVGECCC